MPVSSYAPELMELLKVAAQREVLIKFDTEHDAQRFRFRCHSLRREMRKSNHDLVSIANSVEFRIRQTKGTWLVAAGPADTSFVDKLKDAGIIVELPNRPPASNEPAPATPTKLPTLDISPALQKFLDGDKEDD